MNNRTTVLTLVQMAGADRLTVIAGTPVLR